MSPAPHFVKDKESWACTKVCEIFLDSFKNCQFMIACDQMICISIAIFASYTCAEHLLFLMLFRMFYFFHVKALILVAVVRYQNIVVSFANSLLLQRWDFWPEEHVHLSGSQIPALWKADWFNRKVGLPRKHAIKNEHLTTLWLKVVGLTQAYGKFMQRGYCIKTTSVERQNRILSLPSSLLCFPGTLWFYIVCFSPFAV